MDLRKIEMALKYAGYIERQQKEVAKLEHLDKIKIPKDFDYSTITSLRNEARQKLSTFTPRSLGQALRISGITPADVAILAVHVSRPGPVAAAES